MVNYHGPGFIFLVIVAISVSHYVILFYDSDVWVVIENDKLWWLNIYVFLAFAVIKKVSIAYSHICFLIIVSGVVFVQLSLVLLCLGAPIFF